MPTRTTTDALSPDEDDSESVCSSLDGSVLSEDGLGGGKGEEPATVEEDVQIILSEHVDNLSDKRCELMLWVGGLSH